MTLAVFRQLPEWCALPDREDCWGVVRYSFNDCGPWILFAHNGILKKYQRTNKPWGFKDKDKWENDPLSGAYCWRGWGEAELKEEVENRILILRDYDLETEMFISLPQLYIAV